MGNINAAIPDERARAISLSTPYGKHKRACVVSRNASAFLSTPYGKHKPLLSIVGIYVETAFYSLWET